MPNPVDDAPQQTGPISLPVEGGSRRSLRGFHRGVASLSLIALVAVSLVLWQHPPRLQRGTDELSVPSRSYDPRLERYQTPESAAFCADWREDGSNEASAEFALAVDNASLTFLLSRGPLHGDVHIVEAESSSGPFKVAVSARFDTKDRLEATKACLMSLEQEQGVLFWAEPRHPHGDPRQDVRLNITLSVPRSSGTGKPGHNDLSTDLPLFSHHVGEFFHFFSGTDFERIRLRSSNAPVDFGSLIGRSAFIETSNAEMRGFFAGLELDARTSNGELKATAFMFGDADGAKAPVNLWTSNGEVNAALSLASDYKDNSIHATIRTSNAKMLVQTRLLGDNTTIVLNASTSNGPADLYLDSTFEGEYDIQTSLGTAKIDRNPNTRDPSGGTREHVITRTRTGKRASGLVYWGKDGEGPAEDARLGEVTLKTSNAPVVLHL
ncbi:hypothetical protein MIND_01325000 [Mycena indigotica]|uniref:Uncharacterized protein n=1 Tax=Mycena indigotica TaxID=2126181 RepID=A0A8H6VUR7_9AGAR|nr:uncharacterized protein MIND_01325000 [Mycena indigotica]KAF7290838.1 hypothetical protein MIND_01325000 [Mycena indigotica]